VLPYTDDAEGGNVLEHLQKALDFTAVNCGDHGMPLAFFADWNDCLNLKGPNGKGESIWVAFLYHRALLDFIELCRAVGKNGLADQYDSLAAGLRRRINGIAWDGSWYLRAFNDNGDKIGSRQNKYGRLFLNAQTWAIYSGVASPERGRQVMDQVREKCNSLYGLTLLWPAFRKYDPLIGTISLFPPGLKENAGIFCHANTWAIIAECLLGRGDYAMEYYRKMLPPRYNDVSALRRTEPYIFCQVIAGPEHPDYGIGRNSWLTGTASWMFVAFSRYILGIKPQYDGFVVEPCLPAGWPGYRVWRRFRGVCYEITVDNPQHVCTGVKQLWVDGNTVDGTTVPYRPADAGKTIQVKVQLGR
jgi:cellobiose phosphorylase